MSSRAQTTTGSLRPLSLIAAAIAILIALAAMPAKPAAAQSVCPAPPATVDPNNPRIVVSSPAPGAQVTSPVVVSGQAGVFEANVVITIFDAAGQPLVETFTTALGAGPDLHPFQSDPIPFSVSQTQQGCIWVAESSADETVPAQTVAIPVTLVAAPAGSLQLQGPMVVGMNPATYGPGSTADLQAQVIAAGGHTVTIFVQGKAITIPANAPAVVTSALGIPPNFFDTSRIVIVTKLS